jgi:hypothetical protein
VKGSEGELGRCLLVVNEGGTMWQVTSEDKLARSYGYEISEGGC